MAFQETSRKVEDGGVGMDAKDGDMEVKVVALDGPVLKREVTLPYLLCQREKLVILMALRLICCEKGVMY
jgi:hypothetical protein